MDKTDKQLLKEIFERAGYKVKEGKFEIFNQKSIVVDNHYGQLLHFDFEDDDSLEDMGCLQQKNRGKEKK